MSKKKILFITPTLGGGGAERMICTIANNLDRGIYDVNVLVVMAGDHVYAKKIKEHINVIYGNQTTKMRYNLLYIFRVILTLSPDVVFSGAGFLNVLLAPFIPLFRSIRWIARETNTISENTTGKFELFLLRKFYNNFHVIIAQCEEMKADLIDNFAINPNIVKVINNPLEFDKIQCDLSEVSTEARSHFDNGKINLVACGRLAEQKGFDLLLEKFSCLTNLKDYHLTIIGKDQGGYGHVLNTLIREHQLADRVSILPFQSDIHNWIAEADCFILSSRYEGFPNILLEALACGVPALANDCPGGITEIINSDNGMVFDFAVEGSFHQALSEMQSTKFEENKIKESVKSRYDVGIIMSQYKEII